MIKPKIKGPNPEPPEAGTDEVEQVIAAPTGTLSYTAQEKGEHCGLGALVPRLCQSCT